MRTNVRRFIICFRVSVICVRVDKVKINCHLSTLQCAPNLMVSIWIRYQYHYKIFSEHFTCLSEIQQALLIHREKTNSCTILWAHVGNGGTICYRQMTHSWSKKLHKFPNNTNLAKMLQDMKHSSVIKRAKAFNKAVRGVVTFSFLSLFSCYFINLFT